MEQEQRDAGLVAAVEAAGSLSALGRIINRRQSSVSFRLRSGKPIWAEDVLTVEAATGVSRHDLRPDIYPRGLSDHAAFPSVGAVEPIVPCDRHAVSQRAERG